MVPSSWTTPLLYRKRNGWALYLQTDTNAAVFGGDIDASVGTITSKNTTVANGDNSYTYYGPNSTWSSYLLAGSGTNQIGTRSDLAQVLSTNGNLHIDAGVSREIYMNYYAGRDIYFGNGASGTNGIMKQDGSLGLGTSSPGAKLDVRGTCEVSGTTKFGGFVGINGRSPDYGYALDVSGFAKADSILSVGGSYSVGAGNATVVKHGGILAMDQFTWRRVVPQRWSGYIVWTPVANDHSAFAIRVVNNSNAGAGSRDWRVQTDYYSSARYISSRYNGGWLEFSKAGTSPGLGSSVHYYHVTMYGAFI